ncbi:gamma-glutamyltransferase [Bifidobacterium sp.]|jgi:gamma-glutamyltranspeptidase/glutathione hydrolase|uniref:gamma-glutamyltransferase n=1 Tax=Bifidobacterium sp. TaxID=41200 RepID=UPI0025C647D5|nr:gamma-glutamyltransferase [Bifidobacterium sp.]MCH4209945.1 gamma-glutamyltransferase [Bifidobacterium sp.]MCI1225227.1 gamma-glutamyltransferase [Bifidobacterium sp.]
MHAAAGPCAGRHEHYIDFVLNPQLALDAPRWKWDKGNAVRMEPDLGSDIMHGPFRHRVHHVAINMEGAEFGRGQVIMRNDNGVFIGGTESRADSNNACI